MKPTLRFTRRQWLGATTGAVALSALRGAPLLFAAQQQRPKVAAIVTEFSFRSHAHVILENFVSPYYFNGQITDPGCDVVSLSMDQVPETDIGRKFAEERKIPIYPSIAEALTLGGDKLAVDAVLSIGEHGKYPSTEKRQVMYPRKQFFDAIVAVFRKSGRVVPLFNDKHLSYRFDWATEMMNTAKAMKIPFMAGSSVPLAQRRPPLELPAGAVIEEAVSIHSGGLEGYDFHALEVLQSMVESRKGGETGVSEIQLLEGDAVWKAAAEGRWTLTLADAAMQAQTGMPAGPLAAFTERGSNRAPPPVHAILVKYKDGLKATMLRLGNGASRWNFACKLAGTPAPVATSFYVGPWNNRNLFKALSHAIQTHFREGKAPYPVERTYLTTGMVAAAMDSRFDDHKALATPQLEFAYQPRDYRAMREMGESWKIITEETPEPKGTEVGTPRPKA